MTYGALKKFTIISSLNPEGELTVIREELLNNIEELNVDLKINRSPKHDSADQYVFMELLSIAPYEPYTLIFISGDRDFFRAISMLTQRGNHTIILSNYGYNLNIVNCGSKYLILPVLLKNLDQSSSEDDIMSKDSLSPAEKEHLKMVYQTMKKDLLIPSYYNFRHRWGKLKKDRSTRDFVNIKHILEKDSSLCLFEILPNNRPCYWPPSGKYQYIPYFHPKQRISNAEYNQCLRVFIKYPRGGKVNDLVDQLINHGPTSVSELPLAYVMEIVYLMIESEDLYQHPDHNLTVHKKHKESR